jgi:hypothetical protein
MRKVLTTAGITFAVINLALMLLSPPLKNAYDAALGRLDFPGRPGFGPGGVQELMVYYDPWPAAFLSLVYTLGFAAIGFLVRSPSEKMTDERHRHPAQVVSLVVLTLLELVWLALVAIQFFCRGPNWNFYWPGEAWDSMRVVAFNSFDLSEYFWIYVMETSLPDWWLLRESPGLGFLVAYFASGIGLALLFRSKHSGVLRCLATTILFQLAFLVPLKIFLLQFWHLKYFVTSPQMYWNI